MSASSAVYAVVAAAASLCVAPWGAVRQAQGRDDLGERWSVPSGVPAHALWLHAASVGEVNAVTPLARAWQPRPLLWTTQTVTGRARAAAAVPSAHVRLAPVDAWGVPARVMRQVRPRALVIAETELWPGLLRAAHRAGVPVAFVNARMSARSCAAYRRLGVWLREPLAHVACIAAQSGDDAERFLEIGAPAARVEVTGNMKWDQDAGATDDAPVARWLRAGGRPVVVAGSTRPGEEDTVLRAARLVAARVPGVRVVVAPRHLERVDEAEAAVRTAWPEARVVRRTAAAAAPLSDDVDIVLLDTLGELAPAYAVAVAAFVGGTLRPFGGHNVGEPALSGVPVAFGQSTTSCADAANLLLEAGGARRVDGAEALAAVWTEWLVDTAARDAAGAAAQAAVAGVRGATERTLAVLRRFGVLDHAD